MRGVILLTEARSGSTWLGSLARNAGMGNSGEWLDENQSGLDPRLLSFDQYLEAVLGLAGSGDVGFFLKIFPAHLFASHKFFPLDFIKACCARHDVKLIILTRRDRLRQAISFSRGLQSKQWVSDAKVMATASYDFDRISRIYFQIGRSYDFWESYVAMNDLPVERFVYEDLVEDPRPFLSAVAQAMGRPTPDVPPSELTIQRDARTEEWAARFRADVAGRDCLDNLTPSRLPARSFSNLVRFLRKKPMKPYPYVY